MNDRRRIYLWAGDKAYSDLMKELWGSPGLWNVRKTYVEVARKLGVDEETVRNRIKNLKDSGFLEGWRLLPNPSLLGLFSSFLFLEARDQDSKDEIISKISKMEGVLVVASFYGPGMLVTLLDDGERNSEKRIMRLGIKGELFQTPGMNLPSLKPMKMTATDWQIIRLLLRDAELKPSEIASKIKISTKTVNRRLTEMLNSRAVFIMPMVNLKRSSGISCQLIVECEEEKLAEILELVSTKVATLVFRATAAKSDLILGFNATNVSEGNVVLKFVKKLPGVRKVRMNIVEEVVHVFDWLSNVVDENVHS